MNVFLVPIGQDQHELYCEVPDEPLASASGAAEVPSQSWWRRQVDRFGQLLAEAEDERRRRERGEPVESSGLWRWLMRKIAEAVAEQRLLWMLRKLTDATLVYPADHTADAAVTVARVSLQRDFEKHRRWLVIDALLMVLCAPLTVIPGPNVPALFFSFRAVAHYLSMRGASCGLHRLRWHPRESSELSDVRAALSLPPADRRVRIDALAAALGLERLGAFVERMTE
jgi:hypothetical protein